MKKLASTIFFLLGAISILVMSIHYFQSDATGIMKGKSISSELWYPYCLRTHILFGVIAIFIGPFQFLKKWRIRFTQLHRKMGYLYFGSVLVSSLAGLVVAQYAMGGWSTRVGFSVLALLWGTTTILSITSIVKGNLLQHRKWIYLSYGLTFSAITQRTFLLTAFIGVIDFMDIYRWSAWIPWILNSVIAMILFERSVLKKQKSQVMAR